MAMLPFPGYLMATTSVIGSKCRRSLTLTPQNLPRELVSQRDGTGNSLWPGVFGEYARS
jgi:hypothetical protein